MSQRTRSTPAKTTSASPEGRKRRELDTEGRPITPRPVKDPDYAATRKKVMKRFSKTLDYLAK